MRTRIPRPSPAMSVALIALFVALGGGAYAGVTLSNNSVLSATIKNGEVKKADLAPNAVTGAKIKDGEVKGADVGDGSLRGSDIADGSVADADIAGIAAAKVTGKVASAAAADTATTAASATNATTAANADKLDNLDSTTLQAKPMWALVNSTGTIVVQSGGVSVASHPNPAGGYYLNFGTPLTGKAIVATLRYEGTGNLTKGEITASICGGALLTPETQSTVCFVGGTNDTNHLFVNTADSSGAEAERDFYVVVFP